MSKDAIVRLKVGKMQFETRVNVEAALKMRRGDSSVGIANVIADNFIYTNIVKGMRSGADELENSFGTTDMNAIVERMVKKGDIEIPKEIRDEALEARRKQVVDFLVRNAVDARTGRPFTPDTIESSLKQGGVKIENVSVDKQISKILDSLRVILPIKIETKKIKVKIAPEHTGKVYGLIQEYKEKEDWMNDGSLEVILNIPVGLQMEFYDKLNSITHGSALTQEIKEN